MKHGHKKEPGHKSLGVYRTRIKKMKESFRRKEFLNELAWWILLGCTAFLSGVVIYLIIG